MHLRWFLFLFLHADLPPQLNKTCNVVETSREVHHSGSHRSPIFFHPHRDTSHASWIVCNWSHLFAWYAAQRMCSWSALSVDGIFSIFFRSSSGFKCFICSVIQLDKIQLRHRKSLSYIYLGFFITQINTSEMSSTISHNGNAAAFVLRWINETVSQPINEWNIIKPMHDRFQ